MIDRNIRKIYPDIDKISLPEAYEVFSSYSTLLSKEALAEVLFEKMGIECDNNDVRSLINYATVTKYPNETTIKAAFINTVLSKNNNHVTIFELNTNKCRVDLCKINGESIAFEIKTDLDNLKRLSNQLSDYLNVFEKVYVICSKDKYSSILKSVPKCVGIYTYTTNRLNNYVFTEIKAASIDHDISSRKQLELIPKNYRMKYSLSDESSEKKINEIFKKSLKEKYAKQWSFLIENKNSIYDIDYQWFFKNQIDPSVIYSY